MAAGDRCTIVDQATGVRCTEWMFARGLIDGERVPMCGTHYQRWRRHGSPHVVHPPFVAIGDSSNNRPRRKVLQCSVTPEVAGTVELAAVRAKVPRGRWVHEAILARLRSEGLLPESATSS